MRVKICGLTRLEDVHEAVQAGADALGFVFYSKSKRAISIEQARELLPAVPAFVQSTALFVNPERSLVDAVLDTGSIDLLQFHGDEPPEFCASFGRRWIKAVPMKSLGRQEAQDYCAHYSSACGLLFDAFDAAHMGGSGERFDWQRLPQISQPLILAGGLDADNVQTAIRIVRPWAVDVSSGVETAPGLKSSVKMRDFIQAAKTADL